MHPTKASQQQFLATCIDVHLEKNVKHAQWHKYTGKRGHQTTYFVLYRGALLCPWHRRISSCVLKNINPPPTHTFLK